MNKTVSKLFCVVFLVFNTFSIAIAQDTTILLKQAQNGNAEAQYKLSKYYLNNYNYNSYSYWLELSANNNNIEAQVELAMNYYYGNNKYIYDIFKSLMLLSKTAEMNDYYSQYFLGKILLDEHLTYYNPEQGLKWIEKAAIKNYKPAIQFLLDYSGDIKNIKPKIYWEFKAAHLGDVNLMLKIANYYYQGLNLKKNIDSSVYWMEMAGLNGYSPYMLGNYYQVGSYFGGFSGELFPKDINKAIYWYSKENSARALFKLSQIYFLSPDINKKNEAKKLLKTSAEMETDITAMFRYAEMLENGLFFEKNIELALFYYKKILHAIKNNLNSDYYNNYVIFKNALINIGSIYELNFNEIYLDSAILYYKLALNEDTNSIKPNCGLGRIYLNKNYIHHNDKKAESYLLHVIKQENTLNAYYLLGKLYSDTTSELFNLKNASIFYKKYSKHRYVNAKIKLGIEYIFSNKIEFIDKAKYWFLNAEVDSIEAEALYQLGLFKLLNADFFDLEVINEVQHYLYKSTLLKNYKAAMLMYWIQGFIEHKEILYNFDFFSNIAIALEYNYFFSENDQFYLYITGNRILKDPNHNPFLYPKLSEIDCFTMSAKQGNYLAKIKLDSLIAKDKDLMNNPKIIDFLNCDIKYNKDNPLTKDILQLYDKYKY